MNKKGMEISVNTIIILIIAIVTLVIVLGFITGTLQKLFDKADNFPSLEMEPTADDPISFLPATMSRGKANAMTVGFYNNELADIDSTVIPSITCQGTGNIEVVASGLNIAVGSWKEYSALVTVPSDTAPGQYSCTLGISQTEETFFMDVK